MPWCDVVPILKRHGACVPDSFEFEEMDEIGWEHADLPLALLRPSMYERYHEETLLEQERKSHLKSNLSQYFT